MIQADVRSSAAGAVPSTGNIDQTSPMLSAIERNDVYFALGMIDARATALRQMLELVKGSMGIDDPVRGLIDVIAFEVMAIEDLADERLRERTIQ